ncbi:MAG: hypothetical protein HWQ35_13845 [Nostoc sp. NMS1]|uniref:hypothetical protein n=1 Tax=unclassified Nostoc TaxID=2593658 RepID=UPI0025D84A96|nr:MULTISPECIES: hypothetical protein [unclassified Nostoc]MBN3907593.1 hypothetical protein [Nostoc sp. NMS1]MBN3994996.1 hypothetical protein [Nostoc sp. NMS2]
MATDAKTQVYYINLGGSVGDIGAMKFAWRGKKDAYKNIAEGLGVKLAKDTDSGLMFGANSPRPAEVRIGYTDANGNSKSAVRFCEPDKIGDVTTGGKINGKKIKIGASEYNINGVSIKSN